MSTFDTNRLTTAEVVASGISRIAYAVVSAVIAWNDARVTRKSLSRLTARELDDIGLTYADIDSIVARDRSVY
jgi:uncharacterized protein YjiS (DUF1127 family)